jgi:hypothetical protein
MKHRVAFLVSMFLLATAPAARAGTLATPPLWTPGGGTFWCEVASLVDYPLDVRIITTTQEGLRTPTNPAVFTLEARNIHAFPLRRVADPGRYIYCEVEVFQQGTESLRGFGPARFVRLTASAYDAEGNFWFTIGAP